MSSFVLDLIFHNKFPDKSLDPETGLYYYGARYLDPKYSMWISTDPALGEYIPQAPINDEAKKNNQNLPGMGGLFNHVNHNLYHYAGNNPIKYVDPDGRKQNLAQKVFTKALNYISAHNERAAAFIKSHTNVSITRNVYEGKEIHAIWASYNYDETEIYYQDNLSIEVCGIPLNNIQVQSTADHPSGIDDTIPSGTNAKADVGKSGATKKFINDTLLFDDKGDFLHPPAPGQSKPGSEGCIVTENEADNREVMNILRDCLGIPNGDKQVLKYGMVIYPRAYFCPKSVVTGKINLSKNTYTIHHFASSWFPEGIKERNKALEKYIDRMEI